MANLRVLQKDQYLKCYPNRSRRISVTEICMPTVYSIIFYTTSGPVIFMQVIALEKERDTTTNYYC